jgi:hypothetical protein
MIGEDCDRLVRNPRDELGTDHSGVGTEKAAAQQIVNPTDEWIRLVVIPSRISRQACFQGEQRERPCDVDFVRERIANLLKREPVLASKEPEDAVDQRLTNGVVS